ncbi:MAG TPA: DUF5777 family beta-barrel protein [Thermoanaerobaculia bacterium]|nr:DUF5777 family beta-barrel protein [Thermoanaerobaculia bacterium]
MIKRLFAAGWLLVAGSAFAQAPNPYAPVAPIPVGDILLTLPSSHIPDKGTWEVRFSHRFNQSIDQGQAFRSLFGLDNGANVGIGLSYVPFRDFEVSLLRSNVLDTYDLAAKYVITQQARRIPFSSAIRIGGDFRTEQQLDDRVSAYAQAIVSHQFGSRFDLYIMPTYITKAGRASSGETSAALFKNAFNVPAGAVLEIGSGYGIVAEVIPPNRDLPQDLKAELGWAVGIKHAIGGHLFEILLTNSNGMTTDQYVTSTYNGAPFRSGDLRLGFNIERRWGKPIKR